jgi:hypothetical protein
MLNQSIFGKAWTVVWFFFFMWLAISFAGDFVSWFLANITEAKSWTALLLLATIVYFTNPTIGQLLQRFFSSASNASTIHAGGRVENAYFLGRQPISIPDAPARIPLTEGDRALASERRWLRSKSVPNSEKI